MASKVPIKLLRQVIKTEAVGIGEHHDKPNARLIVRDWIEAKAISHLVMELYWDEGWGAGEVGGLHRLRFERDA